MFSLLDVFLHVFRWKQPLHDKPWHENTHNKKCKALFHWLIHFGICLLVFSIFIKLIEIAMRIFKKNKSVLWKRLLCFLIQSKKEPHLLFCYCFQGVFRSSMFSRFCVFLIWKQKKHTLCKQRSGFCEITFFFFLLLFLCVLFWICVLSLILSLSFLRSLFIVAPCLCVCVSRTSKTEFFFVVWCRAKKMEAFLLAQEATAFRMLRKTAASRTTG